MIGVGAVLAVGFVAVSVISALIVEKTPARRQPARIGVSTP
jgi:hypothetical protein